jgi:hypothetical protein
MNCPYLKIMVLAIVGVSHTTEKSRIEKDHEEDFKQSSRNYNLLLDY